VKDADKMKDVIGKRPIADLVTFAGQAKISMTPGGPCQKFCLSLSDITENYQNLYSEIIICSNELAEKALDLAATFHQMQRLMLQMCEQQKRINCQS
jgi:hypothetical protein